jgi:hypothetical protein
MENQEMEEKKQDNNKMIEQQQNENETHTTKSKWKDIWETILGGIFLVFLVFVTIGGVKATIHSCRERKEERRREALAQQQSIDWDDYENLIPAPESLETFLDSYDGTALSLEALNELLAGPMAINRPCNITLNGDPEAFAQRYIAPLQVPIILGSRYAGAFVYDLLNDEITSEEFWEWIKHCIDFNNHIALMNCDYWEEAQEYNAVIGRIVIHLQEYLASDGLHYDRIFEEECIENGLWDWFESQNKIVEIDSLHYCALNIVDNPYRQFEVFVYKLVEEYDVPADRIFHWLENCPLLDDNHDGIPLHGESVLPSAPALVRDSYFCQDNDTIWVSDVAMEWVVELKNAVQEGFEDWDELIEYNLGLDAIISNYFSKYFLLEFDFVVNEIEQKILEPQLFDALVEWMTPTVTALLEQFGDKEKQMICEHFTHLLEYLHDGSYKRDLEYERIMGPVETGLAIEYAPTDYVIIDGEVYEGTRHDPYRADEIRLFVALHYGLDKNKYERLVKEVLNTFNK